MSTARGPGGNPYDVLVVGAGPSGLSLALSLAALDLRIAVIECQDAAAIAAPADDGREIALTHGSMRILRTLGAAAGWSDEEVSPIRAAQVSNGRSTRFLDFRAPSAASGPLGYLVANRHIRRELYRSVQAQPRIALLCGRRIGDWRAEPGQAAVRTDVDGWLGAGLLVAADSRHSATRRALGIAAQMHDFGKTMLVARVAHARPHDAIATEWFDFGRTLAALPLAGRQSSIIVTLAAADAARLLQAGKARFETQLNHWLDGRLGAVELRSAIHCYPLVGVYARRFIGSRLALVGDAAVGMHPVTAHGFNFGLSGQKLLAACLAESLRRGHDIAADGALARYERRHRRRTWPLYQATNAIVRLYTSDSPPARLARELALGLGARLAPFKRAVARELSS
jgi:ubiquinone biosynthesis UbiH/UbiF/VisC/COQ6 family hydroxylase